MAIPDSTEQRRALVKAMSGLQKRVRSRTPPYHCFLDQQPSNLVPVRALPPKPLDTDICELMVNPSFRFGAAHDPIERSAPLTLPPDLFLSGHAMAWVQEPGLGMWMPYWARDDWAAAMVSLRPGMPAPSTLNPAMRETLAAANILVAPGYVSTAERHWTNVCMAAKSRYHDLGYAVVRELLHPFQLCAMRRYYRDLVAGGGLPLGDSLVRDRYQLHSEELAKILHLQLTGLASRIAGESVKPSYVYFSSYRPGASLPRHTDREQCEFSISLLVDYSPDPKGLSGWPLILENPAKQQLAFAADLAIGDALFYKGRQLVHHRPALPAGHRSTSLFLHYVRTDFSGRLW